MSSRSVNLALLAILIVEIGSGAGSLLAGTPDGRWVLWVHRGGAFALLPLCGWKLGIIVRSYRKRGLTVSTLLSALLGALLVGAFVFGLLWSTAGAPGITLPLLGALTGLGVHIALAVALIPLLALHTIGRWRQVRLRRPDFLSRRAALRYLALSTVGLTAWQASEALSAGAGWSGASRRFTGSREVGRGGGNDFPTTNWFTDPIPRLDPAGWRLRIYGAVAHEALITWDDLQRFEMRTRAAVLDCTSGWYTEQEWSGVRVAALLSRAVPEAAARSVVFHSATGYTRRFALAELDQLLLATQVGGQPLASGHGAPLRLVAPGWRGFAWVKWVVAIELSPAPAWLQSPLPLQ